MKLSNDNKDCIPYWKNDLYDEYEKLWKPTKNNIKEIPVLDYTLNNSWFNVKQFQSINEVSKCSFEFDKKEEEENTICRKIRIYPNEIQKQTLKRYIGVCRKVYNQTSNIVKNKIIPFNEVDPIECKLKVIKIKSEKVKLNFRIIKKKLKTNPVKCTLKVLKIINKEVKLNINVKELSYDKLEKFKTDPTTCSLNIVKGKGKNKNTEQIKLVIKVNLMPWKNPLLVRDFLVPSYTKNVQDNPWMEEVPTAFRTNIINKMFENLKSCKSNKKAGNIKKYNMPLMRKKTKHWSIPMNHEALKKNNLCSQRKFGLLKFSEHKYIKDSYIHDFIIHKDENDRYYLIMLQDELATDNQSSSNPSSYMSVDPGNRTRHCVYDSNGYIYEIGNRDIGRIICLAKKIDKIISIRTKRTINHKKRKQLYKKQLRLRSRIKDLRKEIDYKTINFLLNNAKVILMPRLGVHSMIRRSTRNINSKIARQMISWAHCEFVDRLIKKSSQYPNSTVIEVTEQYTTKQCDECGHLHETIKGNKTFKCPHCNIILDRDHKGARGVMIRNLSRQ